MKELDEPTFVKSLAREVKEKVARLREIPLYNILRFKVVKKGLFEFFREKYGLTKRQTVRFVGKFLSSPELEVFAYPSFGGFRFHEYTRLIEEEGLQRIFFQPGLWFPVPKTHVSIEIKE